MTFLQQLVSANSRRFFMKYLHSRRCAHRLACLGLLVSLTALLTTAWLWAGPLTPQLAQASPAKQQRNRLTSSQIGKTAAGPAKRVTVTPTGRFVIVQTPEGTVCRPMTAVEARALPLAASARRAELRELRQPQTQFAQQQSFKITLRGTAQLENNPQAKAAFLRAAAKWEALIRTPITIVLDVDFGPTLFGQPYDDPRIIGSTDPQLLEDPTETAYGDVRQALLSAAANNAKQTAVLNALPASVVPTDLGNAQGMIMASANWRALGFLDPVADPVAESDFGDPPSIGFNSAFTYDFDPSDGIAANAQDFEAAAVHEIGHALGFTTWMGFKELAPSVALETTSWDLFRFRAEGLSFSALNARPRALVAGGSQVFFAGGEEYALSTGAPDGTNGDTNQGSHWKADEQTGRYIGILDPTGSTGQRSDITAADLEALSNFGYLLNPNAQVFELQALADASSEEAQNRANALVVNRYTPARYPAKLEFFRVRIPASLDGSAQTGQSLRVFGFADPQRTGQPPVNPSFLFDRMVTISQLPNSRYLDVQIPNGPTLTGGDLYLGVQAANGAALPISVDLTGRQQGRSFFSTNNGQSFQPLMSVNQAIPAAGNFMAQALFSMPFAPAPAPGTLTLSPAAVTPGSPALTLSVFGSNFSSNSVVRVNGGDRQTSFQTGGLLLAQLLASDLANAATLKVTVVTPAPGGGESVAADLVVSANNPAPVLTRLDPGGAPFGGGNLTLNVYGMNFGAQSRIRISGNERPTTVVSSTQLSTVLSQTDLANVAVLPVTVVNPAPGGGTTNAVNFAVVSCSYTTSLASAGSRDVLSPSGETTTADQLSGFVLNASSSACTWNVSSSEVWVAITSPSNGVGRSVINYVVQAQPANATAPRTARVTVGNQTITILQVGRAATASAASFTTQYAPNTINSVFGAGLARDTAVATTTPLPTTLSTTNVFVLDALGTARAAPFFYVSPSQLNLLLPNGTVAGDAVMLIFVDGQPYAESRFNVTPVAPGLFTANQSGAGVPAAVLLRVKADGSQSYEPVADFNAASNRFVPRPLDFVNDTDRLILVLYGTGFRGRTSLSNVILRFAEITVPVQFAAAQGDLIGLDQINVEIPRTLRGRGEINLTGTVDGKSINPVTVSIK
jgi:uncharacterized protein (TIGR03437 family)